MAAILLYTQQFYYIFDNFVLFTTTIVLPSLSCFNVIKISLILIPFGGLNIILLGEWGQIHGVSDKSCQYNIQY